MTTTKTNEVTFNGRTSIEGLISYLRHCYKNNLITDQSLKDMVLYTAKKYKENSKQVSKKDLYDLATQVRDLVGNTVETVKQVIPKKPVEASKKKGYSQSKLFPNVIETSEGIKLIVAPQKYKNMDALRKAVNEDGKSIVFATYWSKKLLKQYSYKELYRLNKTGDITSFPNDLDLMAVHEVLETEDTAICVSAYTDAVGLFFENELEPVIDEDENGNKFSIRYSNSMEFEVYELMEDSDTEDTDDDTDEEETSEEPEEVEDSDTEETTSDEEEETSDEPAPKKPIRRRAKK